MHSSRKVGIWTKLDKEGGKVGQEFIAWVKSKACSLEVVMNNKADIVEIMEE